MALEASAGAAHGRVLVVESRAPVREQVVEWLLEAGFAADAAADGLNALRRLDTQGTPDLLVVGLELEGLSGVELIEIARRRWLDLPILALPGLAALPPDLDEVVGEAAVRLVAPPLSQVQFIAAATEAIAG